MAPANGLGTHAPSHHGVRHNVDKLPQGYVRTLLLATKRIFWAGGIIGESGVHPLGLAHATHRETLSRSIGRSSVAGRTHRVLGIIASVLGSILPGPSLEAQECRVIGVRGGQGYGVLTWECASSLAGGNFSSFVPLDGIVVFFFVSMSAGGPDCLVGRTGEPIKSLPYQGGGLPRSTDLVHGP